MSTSLASCQATQQRLAELELCIQHYQGQDNQSHWLNEYLDIGLSLAAEPCQCYSEVWQENWLVRLYSCLLTAANNPQASSTWRKQCFEYLYQPFFALTQFYSNEQAKPMRLVALLDEFNRSHKASQQLAF